MLSCTRYIWLGQFVALDISKQTLGWGLVNHYTHASSNGRNNQKYLPIEVKWTETPTVSDTKHLTKFMQENKCVNDSYVFCRCDKPLYLEKNIIAMPWQTIGQVVNNYILPQMLLT
jgi:hypothetical protein